MAVWKPSEKIEKTEHVGRRLFEHGGLKGAADQTRPDNTFEIYHFQEPRDREVSVDRLGKTSIDPRVKRYLNPRGHYAASSMYQRSFQGWAVVKSSELLTPKQGKPYKVIASPIPAQSGMELSENKYHAHIEMPEHLDSYESAVLLAYLFERSYHVEPSVAPEQQAAPERRGPFLTVRKWLSGLRSKIFQRRT